jgi:LysR family transcriptional regulator for bpeEF and oprC
MDKLRAMEYFVCAARERSLSAAARHFDVSVPAVSKQVGALERSLGARLFERSALGLTLTPAGEEFLDACEPALERLAEAQEAVGRARTQQAGPVAIAVQHLLAWYCLSPALPRFHARFPNIQLDLRDYVPGVDPETQGADLRLALVWDERPDEVVRTLARTRMLVCASPQYWARHGIPQRPADLERHTCLVLRSVRGTIMDHWPFERAGEKEAAVVRGWITTSNTNRELTVAAAVAGEGVVRSLDLAIEDHLLAGRLVPALTDWSAADSPQVRLTYRPGAARLPRVRAAIDFLTEVFRDTERRCAALAGARPDTTAPPWAGARAYRRASKAAHVDRRAPPDATSPAPPPATG